MHFTFTVLFLIIMPKTLHYALIGLVMLAMLLHWGFHYEAIEWWTNISVGLLNISFLASFFQWLTDLSRLNLANAYRLGMALHGLMHLFLAFLLIYVFYFDRIKLMLSVGISLLSLLFLIGLNVLADQTQNVQWQYTASRGLQTLFSPMMPLFLIAAFQLVKGSQKRI